MLSPSQGVHQGQTSVSWDAGQVGPCRMRYSRMNSPPVTCMVTPWAMISGQRLCHSQSYPKPNPVGLPCQAPGIPGVGQSHLNESLVFSYETIFVAAMPMPGRRSNLLPLPPGEGWGEGANPPEADV